MTRARRMSRTARINLGVAILAVLAAVAAAALGQRADVVHPRPGNAARDVLETVALPDGSRALIDASGAPVPLIEYRRILSASTVSDWLLMELCANDRVLAVTERSATQAPWRHRFAGKARVASSSQLESLLAMKPDLLLLDSFGDPRRIARLREHGLAVFDLGQMRGLDSLIATALRVGALCGHPDRGQVQAGHMRQFMQSFEHARPDVPRPRALYLSPYGDKLFGGTRGTGYHDMLRYAGLDDAAAERFSDFPEYSAEQVLALDPDLIVTRAGMANALCRHPGLRSLRACARQGAIIELDAFAIDDPGRGLIEATHTLHHAVYDAPAHAP